jgi:hypothetical protein
MDCFRIASSLAAVVVSRLPMVISPSIFMRYSVAARAGDVSGRRYRGHS